MTRLLTALTIAACALSTHCSDTDEWEYEGRIYARADATVKRVDVSTSTSFPVAAGDVIYQITLEFPAGTIDRGEEYVYPYIFLPPGETLAVGDEPIGCEFARNDDGSTYASCSSRSTGEGPNGTDVRAGEEDYAADFFAGLSRLTERVVFEVRRPATAPSLEGAVWKVFVADEACELALNKLHENPSCPEGAECSFQGIEYEVEATGCRWRND